MAYNIDSLTVGTTSHPGQSRMTIVVQGDDHTLNQIIKQLSKLEDVRKIVELENDVSVCRELILIKVVAGPEERVQLNTLASIFRANIVDVSNEILMMELTGNTSKLNAFIKLLDGFEISELVRTGITGLTRGCTSEDD